jgi:quercetin dioxygenase-like cupin family protein
MKSRLIYASQIIVVLTAFSLLSAADTSTTPGTSPVVRKSLLTAQIEGGKAVERVEIKEIEMLNPMKGGLHLHPCPVVGYIVEGQILFQIEGQPEKNLKPGDAFFEPANVRISHFDNIGPGKAKFVAYYLLSSDDHELIKMLPIMKQEINKAPEPMTTSVTHPACAGCAPDAVAAN